MAVIKIPNSPFFYSSIMLNGKTYRKSLKTKNRKLAVQLDEAYRDELLKRINLDGDEITFGKAVDRFLLHKRRKIDALQRRALKLIGPDKRMSELTTRDITHLLDLLRQEDLAEQTCKHHIGFVRQVWKFAKANHYRVRDVEFPSIKVDCHRVRFLTTKEESRLMAELDPEREGNGLKPYYERDPVLIPDMEDNRDIVTCLLDLGCRVGELTMLEWKHIDLDAGTIRLYRPKTKNYSILHMTGRVGRIFARRFADRVEGCDYVFTNRKGGQRSCNNMGIRHALKRAGLKEFTIHDLRHVAVYRMLKGGMSLFEVQKILGHSSSSMTARYAWLEEEAVSKKQKAILDDLNERLERERIDPEGLIIW